MIINNLNILLKFILKNIYKTKTQQINVTTEI